ncbi:SPX and EXS domain-containing protein 1 isoform X1 [Tanacetum coccineum]|uniref:SPX and EXS domain-containing protein 1 isoform X1 n=1 Tax=Tanacetum coccineum TaxID=301880 RepID=A0ABQ5CYV1_9ASTR
MLTGTKWPGPRGLSSHYIPRPSHQSLRPTLQETMASMNNLLQSVLTHLVDRDAGGLQMQANVSRIANILDKCCPHKVTRVNDPSSFKEFYKHEKAECWLRVLPENVCADKSWWDSLLGKNNPSGIDPTGWLSGQHINAWSRLILSERPSAADWTIAPTELIGHHKQEPNLDRILDLAGTLDGTKEPFIPWANINRVFIPINVAGNHWVLGILNLGNISISVYDTLNSEQHEAWIIKEVEEWNLVLARHLQKIDYFNVVGLDARSFKLTTEYMENVPQQANVRDCGVLVCFFLEKISKGHSIDLNGDTEKIARDFREEMASRLYNTRIERPKQRKRNPCMLRVLDYPVGDEFWRVLDGGASSVIGEEGYGYLEGSHIDAWSSWLRERRPQDTSWTIMPPGFVDLLDDEAELRFGIGDGLSYPPWWHVNSIILPISIDTRRSVEERAAGHWSMAVLNLRNGTIDVYDSLHGTYDELTRRALESFIGRLPAYLERIGYYDHVESPRVPEFGINFIQDVPIQSGPLGDCGVWVCAHMESLTSGRRLECLGGGTDKFARSYRRRMLQELKATRLEK